MYPRNRNLPALLVAALLLVLAATAGAQLPADATDDQKVLYSLGVMVSQNLAAFNLSNEDLGLVIQGLRDAASGKEHGVDLAQAMPQIQALAQNRSQAAAADERKAAESFLSEQGEKAKEAGGEVTESGMIYIPMKEGTGESPAATDKVKVHYHGMLRSGEVFDSSVDRGQPASFGLNQVIPCWTEGVQKIKVGGKAKLVCPPDLAYGDRAAGKIPPGSALVFEVELLEIVK